LVKTIIKRGKMSIIIKIEKKHIYFLSLLIILVGAVLFVQAQTPKFGHSADNVYVNFQGSEKSLQDLVNQDLTTIKGRADSSDWNAAKSGYENKTCKQISFEFITKGVEGGSWGMSNCGRPNTRMLDEDIDRLACMVARSENSNTGCSILCLKCDEWEE
jgi:hypothetical protein